MSTRPRLIANKPTTDKTVSGVVLSVPPPNLLTDISRKLLEVEGEVQRLRDAAVAAQAGATPQTALGVGRLIRQIDADRKAFEGRASILRAKKLGLMREHSAAIAVALAPLRRDAAASAMRAYEELTAFWETLDECDREVHRLDRSSSSTPPRITVKQFKSLVEKMVAESLSGGSIDLSARRRAKAAAD